MDKVVKTYVYPPNGEKYGFPKEITIEEINKVTNFTKWCIDNGYPIEDVKELGESFIAKIITK